MGILHLSVFSSLIISKMITAFGMLLVTYDRLEPDGASWEGV